LFLLANKFIYYIRLGLELLLFLLIFSFGSDDLNCKMGDLFDEEGSCLADVESILVPVQLTQNGTMLQHEHCLLSLSSELEEIQRNWLNDHHWSF
jgi:hypothetical protein